MKKNYLIFIMIITLGLVLSCSNNNSFSDKTAMITFGNSSSRELNSSNQIPMSNDLYWYYTAEKMDGGYSTGTALTQTPVKEGVTGYLNKSVGPFSYGKWKFTLYGYADSNCKDLIYSGVNSDVSIGATNSTVNVTVSYRNESGKDGYLLIENVNFITASTSTTASITSATMTITKDGSTEEPIVKNLTKTNNTFSHKKITLKNGVYKLDFQLRDNAGNEVGTVNGKYVLILSGRVTKVSGSISENTEYGSFNVTIINPADNEYDVSNGKRFVSTFAQLKKALSDSATGTNTIIFNNNISASETLNISGNVVIDLNSNTITNNSSSKLFTISNGTSLIIKNGGISSSNNVVEATGGSISFDNVSIDGRLDKVIDAKTNPTTISLANSEFLNVNYVVFSEKTNQLTINNCRFTNITTRAIELNQKIDGNSISITGSEFINSNAFKLSVVLSETVTKGFDSISISNNTFAGSGKKFVVLSSAISETLANNFSLTNTTLLLGATVNDLFEDQLNEYQYNSSTGEISK